MKFLDALPTIIILGIVAFLSYIGYTVYEDYKSNADDPTKPGPGGSLGADKPASFGAFVTDSLVSIGQSPQDYSNAALTTLEHPIGTFESIFGVGDNGQ